MATSSLPRTRTRIRACSIANTFRQDLAHDAGGWKDDLRIAFSARKSGEAHLTMRHQFWNRINLEDRQRTSLTLTGAPLPPSATTPAVMIPWPFGNGIPGLDVVRDFNCSGRSPNAYTHHGCLAETTGTQPFFVKVKCSQYDSWLKEPRFKRGPIKPGQAEF
ncbi:hypothetical protein CIHG_07860 [Coccidioides immitis H538.4]|uniref:Uncharacterized protein n=3 Tax=Coccidioides immitis TaxID=5501 RepID=A0A0J8QX37_COCIT|nr:hypothetical protein CIRG_05682 [Coccidioides immitis RMSCC 2394]KMU76565.1 hypothetical protein CISG_05708 [Coccidioides immitis RMSCC 3703]KMU89827.1 hypothetical protein CIHG_07860 [Coccidioides immitis H538.4]